jgi:hypothetical protein
MGSLGFVLWRKVLRGFGEKKIATARRCGGSFIGGLPGVARSDGQGAAKPRRGQGLLAYAFDGGAAFKGIVWAMLHVERF